MIQARHVLATLLVAVAFLPGCSLEGPVVCGDHTDCISCAQDASCNWCGSSCQPLAEACDWPTSDATACADWPADACTVDAWGGQCPTGMCKNGYCAYQISGTRLTTYWLPNGSTQTVCDGEPFVVVAYYDDTGVNGAIRQVTADADYATCSFHLPFLRGGPVTVVLERSGQAPLAVVTTKPTVDFGFDQAGRPAPLANPSTNLSLSVSNLEPWTVWGGSNLEDQVQFWTSGGYFAWGDGLAANSTSASWDLSWEGNPLFSSPLGDYGVVTQLTDRSTGSWLYQVATRSSALPWLIMTDAVDQPASVTLGTPAYTGTVTFDWRFSDFAAYQSQLAPGSPTLYYEAYVSANPFTQATQFATIPDMLYMEVDVPPGGSVANAVAGPITYYRFLPAAYDSTLAGLWAAVPKSLGGATERYVWAGMTRTYAGAGTVVATPVVTPPRSIQIAGYNAMGLVSGTGLEPVVSWLPPSVGTPQAYEVSVGKLEVTGGSTTFRYVLRMVSESTSLRIPPGVLQAGGTYFLRVSADTGADLVTAPQRYGGFPSGSASAITANFTP